MKEIIIFSITIFTTPFTLMSIDLRKIIIAVNFYLSVWFTTLILSYYTNTYNLYYMMFGNDKIHEELCIKAIFSTFLILIFLRILPTFVYAISEKTIKAKMIKHIKIGSMFMKYAEIGNKLNIFSFKNEETNPIDIIRISWTLFYIYIGVIMSNFSFISIWMRIAMTFIGLPIITILIYSSMLGLHIINLEKANGTTSVEN